MNLSDRCKITRYSNAVAAGTTDITPNGIDMAGWDAVLFLVLFGTITATAVTSIKAQGSSVVDGTGDAFEDLIGTAVNVPDSASNKIFWLEIINPREQFVRCFVDRGTANAVVDGIVAIQFGRRGIVPVAHDTTVGGGESHNSPAAGTP